MKLTPSSSAHLGSLGARALWGQTLLACRPYSSAPWSPVKAMTITALLKILTYWILSKKKQTKNPWGSRNTTYSHFSQRLHNQIFTVDTKQFSFSNSVHNVVKILATVDDGDEQIFKCSIGQFANGHSTDENNTFSFQLVKSLQRVSKKVKRVHVVCIARGGFTMFFVTFSYASDCLHIEMDLSKWTQQYLTIFQVLCFCFAF